ncbi:MAG TPA: glycosyltransferase family 9 protein [Bacteroidales bacterium]|nr:glycosyltransferase family 9 protein [Bacteroidales bacterium]
MSLLVIRTSSMGDVIMTLPLLRAFPGSWPEEELVFVTKKPFDRFITGIPGVKVFLSDHHGRHRGLRGVFRVYSDLRKEYDITAVADLHDVLRSKLLSFLFRLSGCKVASIDKGRAEKRLLTKGRIGLPLKHTVERYSSVLAGAGYPLTLVQGPWLKPSESGLEKSAPLINKSHGHLVGVAPLAKHTLKMWPSEKMVAMLNMLTMKTDCTIFLFGSPDEAERITTLSSLVHGSEAMAGRIGLEEEIALISRLDLMIAMDSSNMHLAAMLGVNTLSIWGATHPWAGFSAWEMPSDNQIQIPITDLTCRPCTIYGKGECRRGDLACLNWLTPEKVLEKVLEKLGQPMIQI